MATYTSCAASATGFDLSASGQLLKGITGPTKAITALQDAGKYGINRDGSKVAGLARKVTDTIGFVAGRIGCVK